MQGARALAARHHRRVALSVVSCAGRAGCLCAGSRALNPSARAAPPSLPLASSTVAERAVPGAAAPPLQSWMTRLGRLTFPTALFSYPLYLLWGQPGASHSHYDPQ